MFHKVFTSKSLSDTNIVLQMYNNTRVEIYNNKY